MEPKKGKWGLWYVNGTGYATKEEAEKAARGESSVDSGVVPSAKSSLSSQAIGAVFTVLVFLALAGWYFLYYKSDTQVQKRAAAYAEKECNDAVMAYAMSQEFVKRELRSPSSAKFPTVPTAKSVSIGDCRFAITSYVDGQNALGVTVRNYYSAEMEYLPDTDKWRKNSLTIDD